MSIEGINCINSSRLYNTNHQDRGKSLLDENLDVVNKKQIINDGENKYTEDEIIKGIESANEKFIIYDRRFEFSIHEKTKEIMVKVIDSNTDEVIREIPPEKILDMVACMWEIAGLIVDERV